MKNIKLETGIGDTFSKTAEKAKTLSILRKSNIEFDFNGIIVMVSAYTDLNHLYRDYNNSFIMGWKTIGPLCSTVYSLDTERELKRRRKEQEERQAKESEEWHLKQRTKYNEKVNGIEFSVVEPEQYQDWKDKNNDGYGGACFEFAESWARLMQKEIQDGKLLIDIADATSHELDFLGITGFQYGMVIGILSKHWEHGEALRKWHNKEYNHEGDGIVNPAILTTKS